MKLYGKVLTSNMKYVPDLPAMADLVKGDGCAKSLSRRLTLRKTSMAFDFVLDNMGYK